MKHSYQDCILYERACIECGECDQCDIDPTKTCDNCKKCVAADADFLAIQIDGVLMPEEALDSEEE